MTEAEKQRLIEVLVYLYFDKQDPKVMGTASFWSMIKNMCDIYGIESLAISKAIRILLADGNRPTEPETYYLLKQLDMSVRAIRGASGIYWQKQKALEEEFSMHGVPSCVPRIKDPALKRGMRNFIMAIYEVFGIFKHVDYDSLSKAVN
jgi:hypothetical protein